MTCDLIKQPQTFSLVAVGSHLDNLGNEDNLALTRYADIGKSINHGLFLLSDNQREHEGLRELHIQCRNGARQFVYQHQDVVLCQ